MALPLDPKGREAVRLQAERFYKKGNRGGIFCADTELFLFGNGLEDARTPFLYRFRAGAAVVVDRAGNRLCGGTNGVGFFSRRLYWWGPHKEKGRGVPQVNPDAEANAKRKGITKGKPFCLGAWGRTPPGKGVGRDRPERSEGKLDPGGIPGKREVPKASLRLPIPFPHPRDDKFNPCPG